MEKLKFKNCQLEVLSQNFSNSKNEIILKISLDRKEVENFKNQLSKIQKIIQKLIISSEFKILLEDRKTEIRMSCLTKTVFLFFLKSETPVCLNELQKHRSELILIYKNLTSKNSLSDIEKSIDNLYHYEAPTIYSHFSRIKKAFRNILGSEVANKFAIIGEKNEGKYIDKSNISIIWEAKI